MPLSTFTPEPLKDKEDKATSQPTEYKEKKGWDMGKSQHVAQWARVSGTVSSWAMSRAARRLASTPRRYSTVQYSTALCSGPARGWRAATWSTATGGRNQRERETSARIGLAGAEIGAAARHQRRARARTSHASVRRCRNTSAAISPIGSVAVA